MLLRFPLSSRPSDPPALPRGAREPGPTRPVDRALEPGEADATAEVISTHNITPFVPFPTPQIRLIRQGSMLLRGPGGGAMKVVWVVAAMAISASAPAHAEDMAQMISQYRREHGLSAVKTDPQLTMIAERQ